MYPSDVNIEGTSTAKCKVLQKILHKNDIDLVAIQETHTEHQLNLNTTTENNIHEVVSKFGDITVVNIYKPPTIAWKPEVIQIHPSLGLYIGDFHSHYEVWKYRVSDENEEAMVEWSVE